MGGETITLGAYPSLEAADNATVKFIKENQ